MRWLNSSNVGVWLDVVRRQEKIRNLCHGVWTILQRASGVDQQWLQVRGGRWVRELNVRIEEPAQQLPVLDNLRTTGIQMDLELRPHFVLDFLGGALHRRLAIKNSGRIPIRDVDV